MIFKTSTLARLAVIGGILAAVINPVHTRREIWGEQRGMSMAKRRHVPLWAQGLWLYPLTLLAGLPGISTSRRGLLSAGGKGEPCSSIRG